MSVPNPNQNTSATDDNGQKSMIFKDAEGNPVAVSPETPFPVGLTPTNAGGQAINPATIEKQEELIARLPLSPEKRLQTDNDVSVLLRAILATLQLPRNANTDGSNSDRVTVVNTVPTTVSSIATLTNLSQFNGVQAHQLVIASEIGAWYGGQRSTII